MKRLIKPLIILLPVIAVLINIDYILLLVLCTFDLDFELALYGGILASSIFCIAMTFIFNRHVKKHDVSPIVPNIIFTVSTFIIIFAESFILEIFNAGSAPMWQINLLLKLLPFLSMVIACAFNILNLKVESAKKFFFTGNIIISVLSLAMLIIAICICALDDKANKIFMNFNILTSPLCLVAHICLSIWLGKREKAMEKKSALKLNFVYLASTVIVSGILSLIISFIIRGIDMHVVLGVLIPLAIYLVSDIVIIAISSLKLKRQKSVLEPA